MRESPGSGRKRNSLQRSNFLLSRKDQDWQELEISAPQRCRGQWEISRLPTPEPTADNPR
jgi:hypothetical protein